MGNAFDQQRETWTGMETHQNEWMNQQFVEMKASIEGNRVSLLQQMVAFQGKMRTTMEKQRKEYLGKYPQGKGHNHQTW